MDNLRIIIGPPGTGKTSFLARQLERAAETHDPERIMACSFTRAAVAELNCRELPIPESNIGTLHSIGYRALGCPDMVETAAGIKDFCATHPRFAPLFQDARGSADMDEINVACPILADFNYLRSVKRPLDLWPASTRAAYDAWTSWKQRREGVDYADMIALPLERGLLPESLPEIGFFDEAQDFTPLEVDLVHFWGQDMDQYFLVGDADQSIYAFKGSDPSLLNVDGHDHRVLSQSWRVPAAVHGLARRVIQRNTSRTDHLYYPTDFPGEVHYYGLTLDDGSALADLAQSLEGSVMILATCSYMLSPVIAALRQEGIPFHNPYRRKRVDWNPLWQSKKKNANTRIITRLNAFVAYLDGFRGWTAKELLLWEPLTKGVFTKQTRSLLADLPQEVPLANEQLDDLMGPENAAMAQFDCLEWIKNHLKKDMVAKCEYPIKVLRNYQYGYHEQPRITVGTIHSVKGGEADHVILSPDLSWQAADTGNWEEINRVFYVGLTRARQSVHLLAPSLTRNRTNTGPHLEWPEEVTS